MDWDIAMGRRTLRMADTAQIDPTPATGPVPRGISRPDGALKIKVLRDLITRRLPAFGLSSQDSPADRDSGPRLESWYIQSSGQYARVIEIGGRGAVTTWPSRDLPCVGIRQTLPAYCDVQQIDITRDYVYITSTGLPSHPVGPWQNTDGVLGAWPKQFRRTFRIPRLPWLAETGVATPVGDVGVWVNGIPISGLLDTWRYDRSRGIDIVDTPSAYEPYGELWLRHSAVGLGMLTDPSNGRPLENGEYRYVANPLALRSQLRDNVVYLPRADSYREDVNNLRHSPILGWSFEGLPIYGPYGYSDPLDPASGVRRMISGFVLRNGANKTVDLPQLGRRTLPRWAASLHGLGTQLAPQQFGPDVAPGFELGRYIEDYDYLGDLGGLQGRDFDLDLCNGRYCVTPEFPDGTFAYFLSIGYDGAPAFPYVIGPRSYGLRDGGEEAVLPDEAKRVVDAGPAAAVRLDTRIVGSQQMLTWVSVEGGRYRIDGSQDGKNWINLAGDIRSQGLTTEHTVYLAPGIKPYRRLQVTLTRLDEYDGG